MHNTNVSANNTPNFLRVAEQAQHVSSFEVGSYDANSIQDNIASINMSATQRRSTNHLHESSTSWGGAHAVGAQIVPKTATQVLDNKKVGDRAEASVCAQPMAGYKISANQEHLDLHNSDPLQAFILNPNFLPKQRDLFTALACKDLPPFFRNAEITANAVPIRNLLGIIAKDILPEDQKIFNKCCMKVMKANNGEKEYEIGDTIGFLLQKYGKVSLNRFVDTYSYCGLIAWRYYNPEHTGNPTIDELYDTQLLDIIQKNIYNQIQNVIKPKQGWIEAQINEPYFKIWCCALSDCMNIDTGVKVMGTSLTETFDSVFLKESENSTIQNNPNNYETASMDSSRSQSVLQCIANIFCCGA